jgi:hypothetical protein|tara:strand:- start:1435 stop:2034 length:600 start_codon:yes stop_codon:yes gene_type:complete
MAFWSTNFGLEGETLKDPKRAFRFTITINGIDSQNGGSLMWYAKSVTKPTFTVSSTEHKYLNHTFYYPNAVTWNQVDIKMVDPGGDPDAAATLAAIVTAAGYKPPTKASNEDLTSMSKASAVGALGQVKITQIDADGKPLESWTLWNAWVEEVDFGGTLEYGSDALTELGLKLRYDWARIEAPGGSSATELAGETFFQV